MVLAVLIVLIGVFKLGEVVGYHRAQFAVRFGDSFDRNFNGYRGNVMFGAPGMPRELLPPGGHGAAGTIASIALPNIVVADRDGLEKTVHLTNNTDIREFRDQIASTSLAVGESVIVLGTPGDAGQIEAELIRVLPQQNASSTSSAPSPR
ncbi:MAG: hypothetical protein JWN49_296 [Parcubacteria group bacterium]|nr:hypothetical protein [Parcubacteria group bacterium]